MSERIENYQEKLKKKSLHKFLNIMKNTPGISKRRFGEIWSAAIEYLPNNRKSFDDMLTLDEIVNALESGKIDFQNNDQRHLEAPNASYYTKHEKGNVLNWIKDFDAVIQHLNSSF